ncbi:MAG: hypothetical protein KGI33_12205 [Thaumarchaeota archaeon]|nr:hypothetical protein [Nitrososphaerota archaeon]
MKLSEILPHLQPTYKSVEIDIACVLHEDKWNNFVTLVKFTDQNPITSNQQISCNAKLQRMQSGKIFRIYKKYFAIASLPEIIENFQKGIKIIDGNIIYYYHPIDLINFGLSYYRPNSSAEAKFGSFTTFESASNEIRNTLYPLVDQARSEVVHLGYDSIFDAISRIFETEYVAESTSYVIVKLPVFAKIDRVEIEKRQIQIVSKYHKKLGGLFLRYEIKNFKDIEPVSYDQSHGKFQEEGDFEIWHLTVDSVPPEQSRDDIRCEVNLFYQPLSVDVSYFHERFSKMMAEKKLLEANPLAKIFNKFCSIEELQKMFSQAEVQRSKLDVSDHFERTVSWLFALHGFQSVWLGNDLQITRSPE